MLPAKKPLIHKNKLLARFLLYGLPLVIAVSGWAFIRFADLSRFAEMSWVKVDYESMESVKLFQEYLRIDTTYPDGNEILAAEYLARILEAEGIDVEIERINGRFANMKAVIPGKNDRPLVLHGHLDTEPIRHGDKWRFPPFEGRIEMPFIYGRGAFDMKSVIMAQVLAMVEVKRSGKVPERSLMFLGTSDEERDSWLGTRRLLGMHPEWKEQFWAVITEGGAVEATALNHVKYWGTEFGQKRFVDIWVCDSNPLRLEHLREEVGGRELDRRMIPELERFLPHYAPSRDRPETRALFTEPDRMMETLRRHPEDVGPTLLPPYVDSMLRPLVAAFPVLRDPEGGYKVRLILHLLPEMELEEVWDELIGEALDGFTYHVEAMHPPVASSDFEHEAFRQLDEFMAETYPEFDHGPLFIPYSATDARYFRQYGIPAFGFSPFLILSGDSIKMRGVDERMPLPAYVEGVELYANLVKRLLQAP